jgi:hypothetical protein
MSARARPEAMNSAQSLVLTLFSLLRLFRNTCRISSDAEPKREPNQQLAILLAGMLATDAPDRPPHETRDEGDGNRGGDGRIDMRPGLFSALEQAFQHA